MESGLSQDCSYSSTHRPAKIPHGTCPNASGTHKTSASETQLPQDKESCFSGHASYIKLSSLQPAPFRALISTSSLWWLLTSTAHPCPIPAHPSTADAGLISRGYMCHLLHEVFGDLPPLHSQGIFMIFYFAISFVSGVFKLYKGKDYVLPFSMPPVLPCTQAGSQYPFVELQWIFP